MIQLRFGRLTLIERRPERKAVVRCDCGTVKIVFYDNVIRGKTRSCGCLSRERSTTHGGTIGARNGQTMAEYGVWNKMRQRCSGLDRKSAHNYADRGIKVCERWTADFSAFFADMGPRPTPKHTLERVENDGNYEPSNCRWATRKEQLNNKRTNRFIEFDSRRQTIAAWADEYGIHRCALRQRVFVYGWPIRRALTTPTRQWIKQK